jgi:hypothetical protein
MNRRRTGYLAAALTLMLSASLHAQDTTGTRLKKQQPDTTHAQTHSDTVYVTKSGKKYHREGCRSLRSSAIAITLEDAKKSYEPCAVCSPP